MNQEQIGSFVLNERKKQKLSQKALADKAGITRYQQILEIEKAQFDYGVDVLIKVINALGLKLAFVDPTWEQRVNDEIKNESSEPIVSGPVIIGDILTVFPENKNSTLFDFSKVNSAKEEDDPDKPKNKTVPVRKAKSQPDSPFKRSRKVNKTN